MLRSPEPKQDALKAVIPNLKGLECALKKAGQNFQKKKNGRTEEKNRELE